jgi:hypothetical protein
MAEKEKQQINRREGTSLCEGRKAGPSDLAAVQNNLAGVGTREGPTQLNRRSTKWHRKFFKMIHQSDRQISKGEEDP